MMDFRTASGGLGLKDVFIANLKNRMGEYGDQKRLADAIGVSKATISHWKSGRSSPSMSDLDRLADYFGCSPAEFLIPPNAFAVAGDLLSRAEDVLDRIAKGFA